MAGTLTVTGKTGPGVTLTAAVYTDLLFYHVDCVNNIVSFQKNGSQTVSYVTVVAAATVTATKSGSTWTLTIS
jgi:hypothetical protein